MSSDARANESKMVGQIPLWFGLLGGPTAWALNLVIAYALVPLACSADLSILLYITAIGTILLGIAALLVAVRAWNKTREPDENGDLALRRAHFMALSGVVMSSLFVAVMFAQSYLIILQSPCEPAGSIRI